jgi:hypothetical protein
MQRPTLSLTPSNWNLRLCYRWKVSLSRIFFFSSTCWLGLFKKVVHVLIGLAARFLL